MFLKKIHNHFIHRKMVVTVVTTILCCSACNIYAATHKKYLLSLKDAIYLSLRNNPDLKSSEIDRVSQKYALIFAKNEFEPQFKLTGSYNYENTRNDTDRSQYRVGNVQASASIQNHYGTTFSLSSNNPISDGQYNPGVTFKITQPLIRGFGKAVVEKALRDAFDNEKISRLSLKDKVISTINTIINDYMGLIQAKETLKSDQLALRSYKRTINNDEAMIKAGRMARNDIVQAQASYATAQATIENDKNNIHQAKLTLLDQIGIDIDADIEIPDQINFPEIANILIGQGSLPDLATSKSIALENNTSYQTEGIVLRQAKRALLSAKNQQLWELNMTASATQGGGSGGGDDSGFRSLSNHQNHNEAVGLELSIPIDDVGRKQTLVDAQVGLEESKINYNEQKRQLQINVSNNYNSVLSSKKQLALSKQALALQQKTYNVALIKKNAGRISNFELLNDQQSLTTSEQEVINTQINYINNLVSFDNELGISLDRWGVKIRY